MYKRLMSMSGSILKTLIPSFIYPLFSDVKRSDFKGKKANALKKIVFIRPGKLGDLIVATPFFCQLKQTIPDLHIAVVCSSYNKIAVQNNPFIGELKVVNFHSVIAVCKLIQWIKKGNFDWMIDLTPGISRTSTLISRLVKSERTFTAGMHKGKFRKYFDITTDNQGLHIIDRNKFLIEAVTGMSFSGTSQVKIYVLPVHEENAQRLLNDIDKNRFIVGINCSAGEPERQWSKEKYSKLVTYLIEKYPMIHIVLIAVGEQREWVQEFSTRNERVISLAGSDFLTVVAAMSHLNMFFSPDTSLIHIAGGLGIPVVGMYCIDGENLIRWRAYGCKSKELVALKTHDVNEISVDDVFAAISEIIDSKRNDKK